MFTNENGFAPWYGFLTDHFDTMMMYQAEIVYRALLRNGIKRSLAHQIAYTSNLVIL